MSEPNTGAPVETTTEAEKRTRGPTRPAVKFADIVVDIAEMPDKSREVLLNALESEAGTVTAKWLREAAKEKRKCLREIIAGQEAEIADLEARSVVMARVDELPATLRAALPAAIRASITDDIEL